MLEPLRNLSMKKYIVKYLDKSGELAKIEQCAKKYKEDVLDPNLQVHLSPPLRITITLDFHILTEIAGEFTNLLIGEPFFAKQILSDLVKICCKVLAGIEDVDISVHILIRLISFPDLSLSFSASFNSLGLFTKYGILTELSPVEKYTQESLYRCEFQYCYESEMVSKEMGKCCACGRKLVEVARSRLLGERAFGLIFDPKFLNPSSGNRITQGILVEFRDEFCTGLEIGIRYKLALIYEQNKFIAWGVHPVFPEPLIRFITNVPICPFPPSISELIKTLRRETHGSPWALVTGMASHIAADKYPFSGFLHLKTALLLSLASICSRCPVPILALGDCINLLDQAWHCSPRALCTPSGPNSLLLATHGVCLLHENISLSFVTTAVESELVTVPANKSSKEVAYSTYPLRAAVWLSWQCNKYSGQDVHRLKTLIEIFGIPFLEEVDVNDEEISKYCLKKASQYDDSSVSVITQEDFKKFVDIVSGIQVKMSPMASALIQNYFVASRKERPECLPLKSIKVLTGLSESHARLSLRDTVTFEDAVTAIFLYEESMSIVFGPSMFSEQPKRTITENNPITIAQQMDNILGRFSLWLSSYTQNNSESTQSVTCH